MNGTSVWTFESTDFLLVLFANVVVISAPLALAGLAQLYSFGMQDKRKNGIVVTLILGMVTK